MILTSSLIVSPTSQAGIAKPCLEVAEPPNSLQECRLLGKDLHGVREVDSHSKAMRNAAVKIDLVRRADVQQQRLQLGSQRGRHELVAIFLPK